MTAAARLAIDPATVSPSKAIAHMARSGALVVLTERMLGDLADELGGMDAALRHLKRVAENVNRPIGLNTSTVAGSRTVILAPRSWTHARLRGWVAGHHQALEAMFGPATLVPPDDG